MFRIVTVAKDDGLTIFILKGKIKCLNYDDDFIVQHGIKPGSKIIMTDNTFVSHDT